MTRIYLDYAAATPLDERVAKSMAPFWHDQFYNPSSPYIAAKQVRHALDDARAGVAHWIGAKPAEIIFTAGATESINLAIHGIMQRYSGSNLLVSSIEHDAVLQAAAKYTHKQLPVYPDGSVDLENLKSSIDDQTVLISVGYANNEIGTIQPLRQIAEIIAGVRKLRQLRNNALPLFLHTDASQAACYLDLHASRLGVDLLTLNGGKMYGPKQTGALYIKSGIVPEAQILGGGQEMGLRSGTENVPGYVGLAAALDIAQGARKESIAHAGMLRDELQSKLVAAFPTVQINGNPKKHLPNNMHLSFSGIDGERLVMLLDERGVMASTGSACAANKQTASHVLIALGMDDQLIQGSLRLSVGRSTTVEEITEAADVIIDAVRALGGKS